jgi:hypothetical protein
MIRTTRLSLHLLAIGGSPAAAQANPRELSIPRVADPGAVESPRSPPYGASE